MNKVVITGLGPICALGDGIEIIAEALQEKESAIISTANSGWSHFTNQQAGIIEEFDVEDYLLSPKNYLDRNTELAYAAFDLAINDAQLDLENMNKSEIALIWATAFGCTDTMNRFYTDVHKKGPRFAKPILFPHTYSNTTISMLSIDYKLDGPHLNFTSGWTASSHALIAAYDLIKSGQTDIAFVGASEALSETLFKYTQTQDQFNGVIPGEGACMLVLENAETAKKRQAKIYAEIAGIETQSSPGNLSSKCIGNCILKTIEHSNTAKEVEIILEASGSPEMNTAEKTAIEAIRSNITTRFSETDYTSLFGETFGASAILRTAMALCNQENASKATDTSTIVLNHDPTGNTASILLKH